MSQNILQADEVSPLIKSIQPIDKMGFFGTPPEGISGTDLSLLHFLSRARTNETTPVMHPRLSLFVAHHGFSSQDARAEAEKHLHALYNADESDPATQSLYEEAAKADADIRLYEMNLAAPTDDNRHGPAMNAQNMTMAMAYGMMSVEPGVDFIAVGGFGGGSDEAAHALLTHIVTADDGLTGLMTVGGFEIAAIAGAIVAARLAGIPVFIDNVQGLAAMAVLCSLNPFMADHCACSHLPDQTIRKWFRAKKTALIFVAPHEGAQHPVPGLDSVRYMPLIASLSALGALQTDNQNDDSRVA